MTDDEISIVAPVYNNAATLPELCRRIRSALGPRVTQIILVDDASTDGSREVMAELDVCVVALARNGGQNAAILNGLAAATRPVCCVLDADLEDPPEALPDLVARLDPATARVVFASRDEPRRVTSRLFRRTMHVLFPSLPPHPCLCFAMDRETRERLVMAASEGDYLPAVIGMLSVATAQVSVERESRTAGRSGYAGGKRWRYAARALWSAVRLRVTPRRRR